MNTHSAPIHANLCASVFICGDFLFHQIKNEEANCASSNVGSENIRTPHPEHQTYIKLVDSPWIELDLDVHLGAIADDGNNHFSRFLIIIANANTGEFSRRIDSVTIDHHETITGLDPRTLCQPLRPHFSYQNSGARDVEKLGKLIAQFNCRQAQIVSSAARCDLRPK